MVLQSIRERLTGILAFTILGILVIPFAFVGVNQYFTNNTVNMVARINDTEISSNDFNQSFSDYRRQVQSRMGAAFDAEKFDQLPMRRKYLDSLIDQELITQSAKSLGLDVDDKTLSEQIRSIPAFQVDGQFDTDVYQSRLTAQGLSPKQFENKVRTQVIVNQLPKNIGVSSVATSSELEKFVALSAQERTFAAVMVPAQTVVDDPQVDGGFSTQEVDDWYTSHSTDYQSEEQVVIQYVELDAANIPVGTTPADDYLSEQFEAQKARFISPEQRKVAHILIEVAPDAPEATKETARQRAADLEKRAKAGEDFAELAKEYSQDQGSADKGGDLGWVEPGVMVKSFEDAMYELSIDSPVSEPVQTGFGWHVIKLLDVREASGMSFEEARSTLVHEYQDDQRSRAFLEQADRLVDLVYEDPTTLEGAALEMGLEVQVAGPFGRGGGEGIAANPDVVSTAFSDLVLLQGSVSDPVNVGDDQLVMIRLEKHMPVALKPLEEVRDEIITTLTQNRARKEANDKAEALLVAAQDGDSTLEAVATQGGFEYGHFDAVQRNSTDPDTMLVNEVFHLQRPAEGESLRVVLATSAGYAVVELESVQDGVIDGGSLQAKLQYSRFLANTSATQELSALMRQLRSNADVEVFEENIK